MDIVETERLPHGAPVVLGRRGERTAVGLARAGDGPPPPPPLPSPEEARACVAAAAGAWEEKIEKAKITVNLTSVATHVDGELDQRETLFTVRARSPPGVVGDNEGLLVLWDLGVAVELRPNHDIAAVDLAGIHHGVPAPRLATGLRGGGTVSIADHNKPSQQGGRTRSGAQYIS